MRCALLCCLLLASCSKKKPEEGNPAEESKTPHSKRPDVHQGEPTGHKFSSSNERQTLSWFAAEYAAYCARRGTGNALADKEAENQFVAETGDPQGPKDPLAGDG
jgi:hypothetical protein